MKKAVLFDLDGTLLYTLQDLYECMNLTMTHFGYSEITLEEARAYVGNGAKKFVERALKGRLEKFDEVHAYYVSLQKACDNSKTVLYDGLSTLLPRLKEEGYMLGLISNKPDEVTKEVYNDKLKEYNFDFVLGAKKELNIKPSRDMIDYALKNLGVKGREVVYVGDSEVDVMTSKNAEIDLVTVLWGYRDKEILDKFGAKRYAKNCEELYREIKAFQ